jgi:hypothetical protein
VKRCGLPYGGSYPAGHIDLQLCPSSFGFSFDLFCVHASIAHHWETSLVLSVFISYYRQQELISFYCVQVIAIFQWVAMLSGSSSFFPHIPASAPPSLVDL